MKNKDLCDHDPRCIMSCGLMVDDTITDHIKRANHHKGINKDMIVFLHRWIPI